MEPKVEVNGMEKTCYNCEYNINEVCVVKDDEETKAPITVQKARQRFPGGCDDWSLSLQTYMQEAKNS